MKSLSKMCTTPIIAVTIVFAALIILGCEAVPITQDSETPSEVLVTQDGEEEKTATPSGTSSVSEETPTASLVPTAAATPGPSPSPTSASPAPASPTSLPAPINSPTPSPIPTSTATPVVQIEIDKLNIRTCPATNCSALGSGAGSGIYDVAGSPVKGGQGYTWIPIEYQHEESSERIAWVALVPDRFKQMGDWRGLERIEPPSTPLHTSTPIPTSAPPQKGLCPVGLSLPGVYVLAGYTEGVHYGLDIAGAHGTPHQSPGHCRVFGLYIDGNGSNGLHLRCSDIDLYQISLGHGDFSYDNYETLHWYGISVETFFNEDGTPKLGVENIRPNQHARVNPGDDLHFYMGTTGLSGMIHTHVNAFTLVNGEFNGHNDPAEYMDCSE